MTGVQTCALPILVVVQIPVAGVDVNFYCTETPNAIQKDFGIEKIRTVLMVPFTLIDYLQRMTVVGGQMMGLKSQFFPNALQSKLFHVSKMMVGFLKTKESEAD